MIEPSRKHFDRVDNLSISFLKDERKVQQIAPGVYETRFPIEAGKSYKFLAACQDYNIAGSITAGYPDELILQDTNTEALQAIASATGGKFDPTPADLFAVDDRTVERLTPLWMYFLIAALLIFVGDIGIRRASRF